MHSFAPSLSFLLFVLALALDLTLISNGSPSASFALAAEVAPAAPIDLAARDLGHGARFSSSHRRRAAEVGHPINARSELMLYPGRRAPGATFTWFKTGLGACGGFNVPSDFIVAMSKLQFDTGNHCGATITITAKGKTAQATIVDRCVSCGFNDLDLTQGLYAFFDPILGTFQGDWEYGSGAPAITTNAKPTPTPTPTPKPTPKSTTTSTTTTKSQTTSSTKTSSTTSSTTNTTANSTTASIPAAVATPDAVSGNIEGAYEAFLGMSNVVMGSLGSSD